jgi:hypothetical protein
MERRSWLAVAVCKSYWFDYCTSGSLLWQHEAMAKRKKKAKRFRAIEAVKALARERIGSPRPERVDVGKKRKTEKHKPTLGELLDASDYRE